MGTPEHPVPGDRIIDASDLVMKDITPEVISSLIKFRAGADKAIENIERLKPLEIARAGLNEGDVVRLISLAAEHRRTVELLPAAEKLVELLYETQYDRAHEISLLFGEMCSQARRRAARSPNGGEILGPLEDLFDYQCGPAIKAAATRAKAAKAAKAEKAEQAAKAEKAEQAAKAEKAEQAAKAEKAEQAEPAPPPSPSPSSSSSPSPSPVAVLPR